MADAKPEDTPDAKRPLEDDKENERNVAQKANETAPPGQAASKTVPGGDATEEAAAGDAAAAPVDAPAKKEGSGIRSAVELAAAGSEAMLGPDLGIVGYSARDVAAREQEEQGLLQFKVITNDGSRQNLVWLTGLKCLFARQLPKMPKEYIVRLVFDRKHESLVCLKSGCVIGGICFRPVFENTFAEIAFCAISSTEQVKGYGTRLMNHLKEYAKQVSLTHFLTYADNFAIGYFKKQGFHIAVTNMARWKWERHIKDYEGGTLMECVINKHVDHLNLSEMIRKQREAVYEKIKEKSNSHIVYVGLPATFFNSRVDASDLRGDVGSIPGLKEAGWKPSTGRQNTRAAEQDDPNELRSQLRQVYKAAAVHNAAWPFQEPVDPKDVPDYLDVIKDPIDLKKVLKRLDEGYYKTKEIFAADFKRMFDNCREYNSKDTVYFRYADMLEAFFMAKMRQLVL